MKNLFAVLLMLVTGQANAALITYSDESAFLSDLTPTYTESFETYPVTGHLTSITTDHFSVTTTPTSSGGSRVNISDDNSGTPHPTDGSKFLVAGSTPGTGASWVLNFELDDAYTGIGFTITDALENSGSLSILTNTGESALIGDCCLPNGNELFFGFSSSETFTSFQLFNTAQYDGLGIDEIHMIAKVPTPTPLALLAIGLAGFGFTRKTIKRN